MGVVVRMENEAGNLRKDFVPFSLAVRRPEINDLCPGNHRQEVATPATPASPG
jgi:hypothetical protein